MGSRTKWGSGFVMHRDAAMDLAVLILQVLALMYHFTGLPGHCLSGACERSWCGTGVEGRMILNLSLSADHWQDLAPFVRGEALSILPSVELELANWKSFEPMCWHEDFPELQWK